LNQAFSAERVDSRQQRVKEGMASFRMRDVEIGSGSPIVTMGAARPLAAVTICFDREFLSYFDSVGVKDGCACSRAMNGQSRIVITDVASAPLDSSDSRGVMLRAKVRSLQSTPLIDSLGSLVGMVSTHLHPCRRPNAAHVETRRRSSCQLPRNHKYLRW